MYTLFQTEVFAVPAKLNVLAQAKVDVQCWTSGTCNLAKLYILSRFQRMFGIMKYRWEHGGHLYLGQR